MIMSENNQNKKVYHKFSIYFTEKEYKHILKKADKMNIKAGIYIKSLLIESLKNDPEEQEDNPFKKNSSDK